MTTERVLPAIALPAPARPLAGGVDREARPAAASRSNVRREPMLTAPVRIAMLLGASGAVYAVTLAGVAALQSSSDTERAARFAPWLEAVAAARSANDDLEASVRQANSAARTVAGEYAGTSDAISAYEARLDELAGMVAEVEGSAAALPSRIKLPSVSIRSAGAPARAPKTKATSGASGG